MKRLLLFSHSGFSDENANGITMKNLLSAWMPEEKAEFYCDVQKPDFSAAHHYFRVTDIQAIKSLLGKKSQHIFEWSENISPMQELNSTKKMGEPKRIPSWLKKYKYNFALKWLREYFWMLGPWKKRGFWEWIEAFSPDVICYMVGESIFMDHLVLQVCEKTGKPLILYNGEAFRLIDLRQRSGLERAYYRRVKKLYRKLAEKAQLCVYNCEMLQREYEKQYPISPRGMVAYNSAKPLETPYEPQTLVKLTYFGNLGVGRSEELLRVAGVLEKIDTSLTLDIYGNAGQETVAQFQSRSNICYRGFVDAKNLREIISQSDILVHVETFDREKQEKLKYAFSTKIAQCICSGRAFVSFAPLEMASSQYLQGVDGVFLVQDEEDLETVLRSLISDPHLRKSCGEKVYHAGLKNHQIHTTAGKLREEVERLLC